MSIAESVYGPFSGQGLIFGILLLVSSDIHCSYIFRLRICEPNGSNFTDTYAFPDSLPDCALLYLLDSWFPRPTSGEAIILLARITM